MQGNHTFILILFIGVETKSKSGIPIILHTTIYFLGFTNNILLLLFNVDYFQFLAR